jgi:demethylmenaquinone methyltransferase/2-methoxy-6-polyprenyl-1,4-benzoquinol methylase
MVGFIQPLREGDNVMGMNQYIQYLLRAEPLRYPVLQSILDVIQLPPASRGLDAGCGIGLQTFSLANAIGAKGYVIGMDSDPELLRFGKILAKEISHSARITFLEGNVYAPLQFESNSFDWVWSMDCIGYPVREFEPVIKELMRVVKPGGRIMISGWSGQQILPGYSLLEARLNSDYSAYIPYLKDIDPERHFMRTAAWFHTAGLDSVRVRTFVGEAQAPLTTEVKAAITNLFEMLWSEQEHEISLSDWREVEQLCDPASPDCILDQPGYYAYFTITLFEGTVP